VPALDASQLMVENLAVIERAIAFASRRYRLDPDDAEEFAAVVKLRMVENGYAVLKAYQERSSFATFISIVVQRMALDYRIHEWGKWHASAEAKRLGALAVALEQLLHRDGRTLPEAQTILESGHGRLTLAELQSLAARLPARAPRRRQVPLEEADAVAVTRSAEVEERIFAAERRRTSERVSTIMSSVIAGLPDDERLVLQLRFEGGMTVAQIARSLGLDQKLTYRQIERSMRQLRAELEHRGVSSADLADLIGHDETLLRFDFGKPDPPGPLYDGKMTAAGVAGS
jgi:RNA polymerase sigma factor (sigma-70 family)